MLYYLRITVQDRKEDTIKHLLLKGVIRSHRFEDDCPKLSRE